MVIKKIFVCFVFVLSYPNHKLMKNMNIDKVVQPVQLRNITWEEEEGYVGGEPGCEAPLLVTRNLRHGGTRAHLASLHIAL